MPISRGGNLQNNRRTLLSAMICVSVFLSLFSTSTLAGRTSSEAPVITSKATASGTVGIAFSYQVTATNTPTSYSATGLPTGLTINRRTGLISGTPTAAGTWTVTIAAANRSGTGNATLTLTVNPAAPVITSATIGQWNSRKLPSPTRSPPPIHPPAYGATGLPAGLTVNSATGLISGTPTAAGTSTVTVSATNSGGTGNATLTLTVNSAAPVASFSPSSLTFASQAVGTTSAAQTLTLNNTGNAPR